MHAEGSSSSLERPHYTLFTSSLAAFGNGIDASQHSQSTGKMLNKTTFYWENFLLAPLPFSLGLLLLTLSQNLSRHCNETFFVYVRRFSVYKFQNVIVFQIHFRKKVVKFRYASFVFEKIQCYQKTLDGLIFAQNKMM